MRYEIILRSNIGEIYDYIIHLSDVSAESVRAAILRMRQLFTAYTCINTLTIKSYLDEGVTIESIEHTDCVSAIKCVLCKCR